jgi:hypothetical protein
MEELLNAQQVPLSRGLHSSEFSAQRKHFFGDALESVSLSMTETAQLEQRGGRVVAPAIEASHVVIAGQSNRAVPSDMADAPAEGPLSNRGIPLGKMKIMMLHRNRNFKGSTPNLMWVLDDTVISGDV